MSLSSDDLKLFGDLLDAKLDQHHAKIKLRCQKHEQSMYGVSGDNGLMGDMKSIKKRLRVVESITYIGQGAIAILVAFKEKIFN
jgi:hypothetical protein